MRRRSLLLLLVLLLAACTAGPDPTLTPRADFRLGLVTDVGSVRDGTFNEFAHRGAVRAADEFGMDYTYRESLDNSHYDIHIEDLLADGRNIIVTVGFFMTEFTLEEAQANPDVYFIGVDQTYDDPPDNLLGLQFREDEGGFLAGVVAGMMTETGRVGIVAGEEIPPVIRYVNGFANGVHYTNPEADVLSTYAESFIDTEFGRTMAQQWVLGENVDVVFGAGGLTGSTAIFEAAGLDAWVIGVDQDEWRTTFNEGTVEGADRILTSAMKRVDNGVYQAIQRVLDGTFEGGILTLSAADCGVTFAPFHDAAGAIPLDVQARLSATWRALAGGTLHTGASGAAGDEVPPEPLTEDGRPPVGDDAPLLESCDQ